MANQVAGCRLQVAGCWTGQTVAIEYLQPVTIDNYIPSLLFITGGIASL
jgi:hypothetical protein